MKSGHVSILVFGPGLRTDPWNGVAILSKSHDPVVTRMELPGDPDDRQARYIEAAVAGVIIASIYRRESLIAADHASFASMKIATFNINDVNKRLANLLAWLEEARPDIVCLQELKTTDNAFPIEAIQEAGYRAAWKGQRSWNGVAILSKSHDPVVTRMELPGDPDDRQARYIEAAVAGVIIASIYLPNGNPQPGPKFAYKLAWFERLIAHAADLMAAEVPVVLAGDFNVVPTVRSVCSGLRHLPYEILGQRRAAAAGKPRRLQQAV